MRKLLVLTGFETPYEVEDNKKRYANYRSLSRKDAIIKYIQAGVIVTTLAIVAAEIYLSR